MYLKYFNSGNGEAVMTYKKLNCEGVYGLPDQISYQWNPKKPHSLKLHFGRVAV